MATDIVAMLETLDRGTLGGPQRSRTSPIVFATSGSTSFHSISTKVSSSRRRPGFGPCSSQLLRTAGFRMRARWRNTFVKLPRIGEDSGSAGCGRMSRCSPSHRAENVPQCAAWER